MRPVQASVPAAVGCGPVPGREAPAGTAAPSVSLIKSQGDNRSAESSRRCVRPAQIKSDRPSVSRETRSRWERPRMTRRRWNVAAVGGVNGGSHGRLKGGGMWLRLRTTGAAESRKLRTAGVTANIPHVRPAHRRTKPEEETDNESDNRGPHTNWKKSDEIPDRGAEFNASRNLLWIFFYRSHGRNRKQLCRSSETTAQLGFGCALRLNNNKNNNNTARLFERAVKRHANLISSSIKLLLRCS